MTFRTDRNMNPTAMTTDLAHQGGLVLGTDYKQGDSFNVGEAVLYTAKLLGDPIDLTIRVINNVGFQTVTGHPRWIYVDMLMDHWNSFTPELKKQFIGLMYKHEGGEAMKGLFE